MIKSRQAIDAKLLGDTIKDALDESPPEILSDLMDNGICLAGGTAQLQGLADVAVKKDVLVLSDEIYEKLIYGKSEFRCFATFGPEVAALGRGKALPARGAQTPFVPNRYFKG